MCKKLLYLIAGANGSGKSTLAKVMFREINLVFLNPADYIAKEIAPNAIQYNAYICRKKII